MFSSTATVRVIRNPSHIKHNTSCLITAICCEELARYYRHLTNNRLHIGLIKPSWPSHITISKVNPPEMTPVALMFDRKKIKFEYSGDVRYSGDTTGDKADTHWFIDVFSEDIRNIRRALQLPDFNRFHITIGVRR